MPLAKNQITLGRLSFTKNVSRREVDKLLKIRDLRVLQTNGPIEKATVRRLNESFYSQRPDVEFRVFGFYSTPCDLGFLSNMTNVRNLSVDCLQEASGIESIVNIPALQRLNIGIWSLQDFSFLNDVTDQLETLCLGTTKSKKPDLAPLSRFTKLKTLYLEGQKKNIDVVSELRDLESVILRSITVPGLEFLRPLKKLWSLGIKLGGTRNLAAIEGNEKLKYLELWQILGLDDISVVSTLTGLQFLFLQSLIRVESLPDFRNLEKLRKIRLDSMKGLKDLSSLKYAPALREFDHTAAFNLQPTDYVGLLENEAVRSARVWFGSDKKEAVFEAMLAEYGKSSAESEAFEFID